MRKLSGAPILVLLFIYLWSHFASATVATSGDDSIVNEKKLVTTLPAKRPAKLPEKRPDKKVVSAKKRTVVVVTPVDLRPKKLPARTKVIMNFDSPVAASESPSIVIRETLPDAVNDNEVQVIRRREVTEAPILEIPRDESATTAPIEVPNTASHRLMPALPDSDSAIVLPEGMHRAPQEPRNVFLPPPATRAPIVMAVPQQHETVSPVVIVPPVATSKTPAKTVEPPAPEVAEASKPIEPIEPINPAPTPVVNSTTNTPVTPVAIAPSEASGADQSTVSSTTMAPPSEFIGPPAPPIFDTTSERQDVVVYPSDKVQSFETAHGYHVTLEPIRVASPDQPASATQAETSLQTNVLVTAPSTSDHRVFIRGGYLDAKYDHIESDLRDGATMMGLSVSQKVSPRVEVRIGADIAHGLDQAVTLQNTRMVMVRGETLYSVFTRDLFSVFIGGALGIADIDVTSYHASSTSSDVTLRENAKGDAFLATPEIGSRIGFTPDVSLDLTLQYLIMAGGGQMSSLGGLLGEAALGFRF